MIRMTDSERAILQQVKQDLDDAMKSLRTKWTDYSESRVRAAIRQLEYLLKGETK